MNYTERVELLSDALLYESLSVETDLQLEQIQLDFDAVYKAVFHEALEARVQGAGFLGVFWKSIPFLWYVSNQQKYIKRMFLAAVLYSDKMFDELTITEKVNRLANPITLAGATRTVLKDILLEGGF